MERNAEVTKKPKHFIRLFEYVAPYKKYLILCFVGFMFTTLLSLIPTYLMKPLTDRVFVPTKPASIGDRIVMLHMLIILAIVINVIETILRSILQYRQEWLSLQIGVCLRRRLYAHLQKLSLKFYNLETAGNLHQQVIYDTRVIPNFFINDLIQLFISIVMFLGIGIVLFSLNWILATLLLVPLPIFILISRNFGKKIFVLYRGLFRKMANMSSMVFNTIKGIVVIKTSVAEKREIDRFDKLSSDYSDESLHSSKIHYFFMPALGFILFFSGVFIQWFGGWQVIKGELSLGEMMVFIGYVWQFYNPVSEIDGIYRKYQNTLAASERIFNVLDAEVEPDDAPDAIELSQVKGIVKFDNVSFSYDGKNNVLNNISFEVNPGEITGILGRSGSGKTTLVHLLCRLFEPSNGEIFLDEYNIKKIKLESLRRQTSIVLQDTFLFNGLVEENIAYAQPNASRVEIISAAKAASAHEFIMRLPYAYDTVLGEGGVGLSSGERQRISIARVLLKQSKIIIFDEATASVDIVTQEIIQNTIKKLKNENYTIFLISHHLLMMEITDRIIFLDQGKIIKTDTYSSFIDPDTELFRFLQNKRFEEIDKGRIDSYVI